MPLFPLPDEKDLPPEPFWEPIPWWRMGLVCLGIHAALLGVMFTQLIPERREFVTYVLGVVAGQVTCLAAWGAWGPGGAFTRIPGAIFATFALWFVFVLGMDQERNDAQTPILTAILALGHLLLVAGGLRVAQLIAPGRFELMDDAPKDAPRPIGPATESKFSLLHLMGWMTAIAILSAIGTQVLGERLSDFLHEIREIVPIVVITLTSAGIGIMQVILVSRPDSRGIYLAAGLAAVPLISLVELVLMLAAEDASFRPDDYWLEMGVVLLFLNLIHTVVVWMTYGLMHLGGLRWVEPRHKPFLGEEPPR